ncbi:RsfA family transcriptional regulator [Peribacillus sp. SCS-37]|uniref:RsfA family transcriptional regulator n=1 Tax=Paraperibacillus esterisolvens TaxID=3115296 RepID=UPI0039058A8E
MTIARQDAWSQDEDLLLAEVVLSHIRDGSTQLKAFEEVGRKLSRTSAACGFRWNSFVRKQYKSGIEHAKMQRKESKKNNLEAPPPAAAPSSPAAAASMKDAAREASADHLVNLNDVIQFLVQYDQNYQSGNNVQETEVMRRELETLKKEYDQIVQHNLQLQEKLRNVEEDYRALLQIMEKARKLIFLEEEMNSPNVKFQMDKNGNLERVKK